MKKAVIIVAAGSGTRMGGKLPKQYLSLQGRPLILHTLEKFLLFDPQIRIIVVLAEAHRVLWDQLAASRDFAAGISLVHGGDTRYDSVKNGLNLIGEEMITGIHDAVRPLVSLDTLKRTYDAAAREGSGIPVIEMDDSVRILDTKGASAQLDRALLKRVQTPQVFRSDRIKQAYQQSYNSAFTDDASVYESVFGQVTLVEGNRENIKITTPTDMKLASFFIGSVE
jgi:2-C-methyl-D-erythritol 4-phosphate cytidylyltransferase